MPAAFGFVERLAHPAAYAVDQWKSGVAVLFDYIALAGIALVLIEVVKIALKRHWTADAAAIYALAFTILFLGNRDVWQDTYNFGRVPPLLLLTFIEQLGHRPLAAIVPMSMVDSRISLSLASKLEGVLRGLLK